MLEELQNKIRESFKEIPYPGDDCIVPKRSYLDLESDQVREFFKGRDWREIDIHVLLNDYIGDHSACLTFMTPEAFRYYLPAYMLICIRDYEEADVSYTAVFHHLTRGFFEEGRFEARFECLDVSIKHVIGEFVWTMHSLHSHDVNPCELEAFKSYWDQYYQP